MDWGVATRDKWHLKKQNPASLKAIRAGANRL
jgi:hypothetical protein